MHWKHLLLLIIVFSLDGSGWISSSQASLATLGLDSTSYIGHVTPNRRSALSLMELNWSDEVKGPRHEAAVEVDLSLSLNSSAYRSWGRSLELPEFYFTALSENPGQSFTAGRKLQAWSEIDSEWNLGVFQPRFRNDFLNPKPVGLLGFFYGHESGHWKFLAFASPVVIPDRGMPLDLNGESFVSEVPWAIAPASRARLNGVDSDTRYTLQSPGISELLFHPGGALQLQYRSPRGFWTQGALAMKPINQVIMGAHGYQAIWEGSGYVVPISLYPRILYHRLYSLDAGWKTADGGVSLSYLNESPLRDQTAPEWNIQQEITTAHLVGAGAHARLSGRDELATLASLNYLKLWGGNAQDQGKIAQPDRSTFEYRYPFEEALSLGLRSPLLFGPWGARLRVETKMIFDLKDPGSIWSTELSYSPSRSWRLGLGADLLGAPVSDAEIKQGAASSFIGRYRSLDRVHGGVSYVF